MESTLFSYWRLTYSKLEPTAPSTLIVPPTVISLRTRSRALRLTAADYLNRSPRSARKIINRGRPINKNLMTNRPLSPRFDIDPERSGENDLVSFDFTRIDSRNK